MLLTLIIFNGNNFSNNNFQCDKVKNDGQKEQYAIDQKLSHDKSELKINKGLTCTCKSDDDK